MGGSNFSVSFAAACGGKILKKRKAQILFSLFVVLGALTLGRPVADTLSKKLIPRELLSFDSVLIVLFSASLSLFIANKLRIPQSTSLVTVGSIMGVGLYFREIFLKNFLYLLPFWIFLPVAGYLLTYFLGRAVYPPRKSNFWIYEKLVNHKERLKVFVVIISCYNAFSVGANNVANAVGPLYGAGIIEKTLGLAVVAVAFGFGSFCFTGTLKTTSQDIVPLGLFTATIICIVTGTLMIFASILGIPQSFVMIKVASVFAIGGLKDGHRVTFSNPLTKKTYLTWIITPIFAIIVSFLLTGVRYGIFN